jgi:AcrR family transcriptional regulator
MSTSIVRESLKQQIRSQILLKARALFVHEGYGSFSVRGLAQQLGYSPSALYKHFQNKNEIFDCLVQESFAALLKVSSSIPDLPGEDPVDRLKRGMRAYIEFGLANPDHYRFAFLLQRPDPSGIVNTRAAYEGLKQRVQRCIDEGCFGGGDVDLMAQSLWAAAHGVTSLLIQRPTFPWAVHQRLIDQVIHAAVIGLVHTE